MPRVGVEPELEPEPEPEQEPELTAGGWIYPFVWG